MAVSFTDRNNFPANPDVWSAGTPITESFALNKDSVLHLRWIAVREQDWLDELDSIYQGQCMIHVLERARCNLCWFPEHIQPSVWPEFAAHRPDWEDRC